METKFNSQICTTREQSERLLALGIKKETADMAYRTTGKVVDMGEVRWMYQHNPSVVYKGMMCENDIPTWSLHRLIEMIQTVFLRVNLCGWWVHIERRVHNKEYVADVHNDLFDNIIDCIEWLIKEGYFNEEYLV